MRASSSFTTASFARPYWNAATRYGTAHATTTFHEQYNKRDCVYSYGRCGDFVRQDGLRGLALGYLTKVRFARFLTTPLATELTGLDLTKPGRGAAQSARVVEVTEEFFDLLVRYSHSHPYRDGDYGNVMRSRALPRNSFCIFTGFSEALASREMEALRATWIERYPPPPPPVPDPPPAPRAPKAPWATCPAIDDDERLEHFMKVVLRASHPYTSPTEPDAFDATGFRVHYDEPLFFVQRNYNRRRPNWGQVRVAMVLKPPLRKRLRVSVLRTPQEVGAAFERLRRSHN
mgnify:CR=1 FL=1|jgi:hypothetical protein